MKKIFFLAMVSLVTGCGSSGGEEEKPPEVDCTKVTPPKYADVVQFQPMVANGPGKCTMCHSSTLTGDARREAPDSVNFDTIADATKNARQAAIEVNVDAMPPAEAKYSLTADERTQIFNWTMCDPKQ